MLATSDLLALGAAEQADLVRHGGASARDLVDASLDAIERLDGELGAFITVTAERALAEADRLEPGDGRPLAGVPLAITDILALTEGVPVSFGMRAMRGWVPRRDSAMVRRLRGAGAIVVGKTKLPELGIVPVTEPEAFGPTRTPWDPERSAGGSSGGSAAAVAASMVPLAHGNDGGGSIRIPAAWCGAFGVKPTRGRISVSPAPEDPLGLVVEGPLTRSVADAALFLDVTAGPEPGDPWPLDAPAEPFLDAARRPPPALRVGFTTDAPNGAPVHPDCVAGVEQAAGLLESLGHRVEEAAPAWADEGFSEHFVRTWIAGVRARVDGLALVRGRPIGMDEVEPLTRAMCERAEEIGAGDHILSVQFLRATARRAARFWDDHDVLLTPSTAQPPPPLGALAPGPGEDLLETVMARCAELVPFSAPWNVSGQPAVSVPLHHSPEGLPIGVQLVGAMGDEATLLSLSGQLEEARPWRERRPPVSAV